MRGFEGFFSPVLVPPANFAGTARPPWERQEKNTSSESDPSGLNASATAAAPTPQHPTQHPELAPSSTSSFGSIQSPNNQPENVRELRRRLIARTAEAPLPIPRRAPQHYSPELDRRTTPRRWPARVCMCRICACLAISAIAGIFVVARLVMLFKIGETQLEKIDPGGVQQQGIAAAGTIHDASSESYLEQRVDRTSTPNVQDTLDMGESVPASPSSTPVLSKDWNGNVTPDLQDTLELDAEEVAESVPVSPSPTLEPDVEEMPQSVPASPSSTPVLSKVWKDSDTPIGYEDGNEEELCWIFLHMDKSGGAGVRRIASERWRKDELVFDTVQWRRGDSYAADIMASRWKLLHGGCAEALRNDKARSCRWFTIFRHPVARLLSAYNHCQKAPKDPLCPPTNWTDLEAFGELWGNFALRQFALAAMSSSAVKQWATRDPVRKGTPVWYVVKEYLTRGGLTEEEVLNGMLQPVQEVIGTQYAAVGIAEELDTTMALFDKALSMEGVDWSLSLATLRTEDDAQLGEHDRAGSAAFDEAMANPRIASAMRLDILLYEHALCVFKEQVANHGLH